MEFQDVPRARRRGALARVVAAAVLWCAFGGSTVPAAAYPGEVHQQLSFLAARVFNRCVDGTTIPKLSALDVRFAARASNDEASAGFFGRTLRWQYYDRTQSADPDRWLWLVDTRMQRRFLALERSLARNVGPGDDDVEEHYTRLGRLVSHVQAVTVPAIAVPIYVERFWLLSMSDQFAEYPFTLDERDPGLEALCAPLLATPDSWTYSQLLNATADATLRAIRGPIGEYEASWQVFWRESDVVGEFGEYGSVGNRFGDAVDFRCGRNGSRARCHLLVDDPVYREFAEARHRDALLATMRAYLLVQRPLRRAAK